MIGQYERRTVPADLILGLPLPICIHCGEQALPYRLRRCAVHRQIYWTCNWASTAAPRGRRTGWSPR
jgi:hypothetical protein